MENVSNSDTQLRLKIIQLNTVFDYLVDNSWFLREPDFVAFSKTVHDKLIQLLFQEPFEFGHHALNYLNVLFGIVLKGRPHPDSEYQIQEYIYDNNGNMLILPY